MGLLEFPEAIASAISTIGMFFDKVYWFFVTMGWALSFIFFIALFIGIQVVFIYIYVKIAIFALSLRPRIKQLLGLIDRLFE